MSSPDDKPRRARGRALDAARAPGKRAQAERPGPEALLAEQAALEPTAALMQELQMLRQSEAQLRRIVETSAEGIWTLDVTGNTDFINARGAAILGYEPQELLGRPPSDFVFPDDVAQSQKEVGNNLRGETRGHQIFRMRHKSGAEVWVQATTAPTEDALGRQGGALSMFADITERKRLEAERIAFDARAGKVQKAESLGRMAGAIAHTFNNLLQVVMSNVELALDGLPKGAPAVERLTDAMQAVRRASEVSGLMRSYVGHAPGTREILDLSDACRRSLPMLRASIPRDLELEADLPAPGPAIDANAPQIQQVLTNLVTNAWEATEALGEGRGTIQVSVRTVLREDVPTQGRFPVDWQPRGDVYACLEVRDSGCGIAQEDIDGGLFDPFFTSKFAGRGLGLAAVLGAVRAHGGCVTVKSAPARGATFSAFWPATDQPTARETPSIASAPRGQETVLVVDDEEDVVLVCALMLKRMGYEVLTAHSGKQAIELVRQHGDKIALVILDLAMPEMSGAKTYDALKEIAPRIKVLLASGHSIEGQGQELLAAGCNGFVEKPFTSAALAAKLRSIF